MSSALLSACQLFSDAAAGQASSMHKQLFKRNAATTALLYHSLHKYLHLLGYSTNLLRDTTTSVSMCLHAGAQLLCQAEASRGVGQQAKPATKREQAVAGAAAASTPPSAVPAKTASGAATAGPDPTSYSSVMAGTSYSKLGECVLQLLQ
jgi:hypothetical protein